MPRSKRPAVRRPPRDDEGPVDPVDVSLFRDAMRRLDVVPDKDAPSGKRAERVTAASPASRASAETADSADAAMFLRAMRQLDVVPDKEPRTTRASGPNIRRKRPPRRGTVEIDDRLDLHRSRVESGLVRLEHFVQRAVHRRLRHVIVITGKGHHSPGGIAILRQAVEDWIRRHGSRYASAYSEAPRNEGGSGAFVLYLRRARDA